MNVFRLRDNLIDDYSGYIRSFINIRDERIGRLVDEHLNAGMLWPDPMIQLNPSFERGARIDDLVREGVLHTDCRRIFRREKDREPTGKELRLHRSVLPELP